MRNAVKILIVDDDKASAQVLGEVVKRLGFRVIVSNRASEALNIVRLQTVHAAIVDVLLPKTTGVELVQEFRKTKFGDNPVVLVSGVFKDRTFANDALKKTAAVDFLFKPFANDELTASLQKALAPLMTTERWTVQSLLTRSFANARERGKAIEYLEPVKGLDFPYVVSFLLEAKSTGNLNIVNDTGEIFGVKIMRGTIADVDSSESQSVGVLALMNHGYLTQEDWDEFQANGNKKFSIDRLVREGYVSPHAVSVAKHEQILQDFKAICSSKSIQLNFVPADDSDEPPKHAVRAGELLSMFVFAISEFFPQDYLEDFYSPVITYPIHLTQMEAVPHIWKIDLFKTVPKMHEIVTRNGTIEEMLKAYPKDHERIYQCFHLLVLNSWVMFDDINRERSLNSMVDRYKKLYEELAARPPDKIFEYFGALPTSGKNILDNLLEEYVRSNNPEQYAGSHPELYDWCRKCYDLVKQAHLILTDEDQRKDFMAGKKQKVVENSKQSNVLTAEGLDLLRKGQFGAAVEKLKEAESLLATPMQFYVLVWAEVKAGAHAKKPKLIEFLRRLDAINPEDRRSAFYFMALGLVKKYLGDPTAGACFEKALQMDSQFVEARRELTAIAAASKKEEKADLLTGDITTVVSQLFRRRS
jgi:CheY-like chemotaxis protein/tetratricopeptide (TPR) repeat protein